MPADDGRFILIKAHPKEALKEIRSIIDREQPDLLLGNSCGSFLAQKMLMEFSANF